jgi:hypothetical protein
MALEQKVRESDNKGSWLSRRKKLPTCDSTPGDVGGYINTPTVKEDVEEGDVTDLDEDNDNEISGQIVGEKEILEKEKPLSRKMRRRKKHEQRLERRYQKAVRGQLKQTGNRGSRKTFMDNDPLSATNLIRARPARPCSYCHVPYHHKYAPFSNMKLVPW